MYPGLWAVPHMYLMTTDQCRSYLPYIPMPVLCQAETGLADAIEGVDARRLTGVEE